MGKTNEQSLAEMGREDYSAQMSYVADIGMCSIEGQTREKDEVLKKRLVNIHFERAKKIESTKHGDITRTLNRYNTLILTSKSFKDSIFEGAKEIVDSKIRELDTQVKTCNNKLTQVTKNLRNKLKELPSPKNSGQNKAEREIAKLKSTLEEILKRIDSNFKQTLNEIPEFLDIIKDVKSKARKHHGKIYDELTKLVENGLPASEITKYSDLLSEAENNSNKLKDLRKEGESLTEALKSINDGQQVQIIKEQIVSVYRKIHGLIELYTPKLIKFFDDSFPILRKTMDKLGSMGKNFSKVFGFFFDALDAIFDSITLFWAWSDFSEKDDYDKERQIEIERAFYNALASLLGTLLMLAIGIGLTFFFAVAWPVSLAIILLGLTLGIIECITDDDPIGETGYWWYRFFTT